MLRHLRSVLIGLCISTFWLCLSGFVPKGDVRNKCMQSNPKCSTGLILVVETICAKPCKREGEALRDWAVVTVRPLRCKKCYVYVAKSCNKPSGIVMQ